MTQKRSRHSMGGRTSPMAMLEGKGVASKPTPRPVTNPEPNSLKDQDPRRRAPVMNVFKKGGHVYDGAYKEAHKLYKTLHSHFGGGSETLQNLRRPRGK